jgi:arylsulfatase A-like enzyme
MFCAYATPSWRPLTYLIVLCGMLVGADLRLATAADTQPNVVFIMADDLGWADVDFHGGNAPTPHLAQLAAAGLELTQHYVAPVCSPTRAGLLTGRCWSRFGVVNPQNEQALPMGTTTLASALRSVGYATCLTGKWHLGSLPKWGPNHFGFEHSYGSLAGGVSPWNHFYKQGPYSTTWHRNETLLEETGHVTDLIANEAIQWLQARDAQPFFLYVPFTAVHLPVKEPEKWVAQVPATIQGDVARHYAASIMHLDDAVGKILAALTAAGKRDNTIVVFTSDNGGSTAENNDLKYPDDNCPTGPLLGNNAPWRGQKATLYEGGIRVPTIVHWPGKIDATSSHNGQLDSPLQITDWMPTLCELAGYQSPQPLQWDGMSLARHLIHQEPLKDRVLYSVGPSWQARALRSGPWKLIVFGDGAGRRAELYNLHTDPTETQNQAESYPAQLSSMMTLLEQQQASDRDAMIPTAKK